MATYGNLFLSFSFYGEPIDGTKGIYPDLLHILDLALYVDAFASAYLHWTDSQDIFEGRSRDERLLKLYAKYLEWCVANRALMVD